MRRIRLDLSYDGTEFCGWQIQESGRTVQGVLEDALKSFLKENIRVIGSGRTDSGVHAERQTCHFDTENSSVPAEKFALGLNAFLPADIRIWESSSVGFDFHARFSAKKRIYRYRVFPGPVVPPLWRNCCWAVRQLKDIERLNALSALFVGTHDFTAFCAAGDRSKSKVRTIYKASFFEQEPFWIFEICGNAFLWNMVRSIVGTIFEEYGKENGEETILSLLKTGDRSGCGTTAPARGLSLVKVVYESEE